MDKGFSRRRKMAIGGFSSILMAIAMAACSRPGAAPPDRTTASDPAPAAAGQTLSLVAPVQACDSLTATDLADIGGAGSRVISATSTEASGHPVCAVKALLAPAINVEIQLPSRSWTQRYMQIGCGGLCGNIQMMVGAADGCVPLDAGGFVIAATDMGHQGMGGDFGYDAQRRADFAHRAQHVTALASKKLIQAYYGQKERFSYFNGCSDGGREALIEAQRYPEDFNGIIAGAPALIFQVQNSLHHAWLAKSNTGADGKPVLLANRLPLLHAAVLEACDALDGLQDGLLAEPRLCHFDPGTLQCQDVDGDTSKCLTPAEVATVRQIYDGPRDPKTGQRLLVGGPQFGSELNWAGVFVPQTAQQGIFSRQIALGSMNGLILDDGARNVTLDAVTFDASMFDQLRARHPLFDATNPDLSRFQSAGGKLILWHGWGDQHISPINTIAYHEAVSRQMGGDVARGFERLYLFPGVAHCGGGQGPSSFDLLSPMLDWVERGVAPDAVVARAAAAKASNFGQPPAAGGKPKELPPLPPGVKPGDLPPLPPGVKPEDLPPLPPGVKPGDLPPPSELAADVGQAKQAPFLICPFPSIAHVATDKGTLGTAQVCGPALYTESTPDWAGKHLFEPYSPRDR